MNKILFSITQVNQSGSVQIILHLSFHNPAEADDMYALLQSIIPDNHKNDFCQTKVYDKSFIFMNKDALLLWKDHISKYVFQDNGSEEILYFLVDNGFRLRLNGSKMTNAK